jgi:hypothetical protein
MKFIFFYLINLFFVNCEYEYLFFFVTNNINTLKLLKNFWKWNVIITNQLWIIVQII